MAQINESPCGVVDHSLLRRMEEASLNAWPALQQVLLDGWVLRFSKGFTRRANCVTPVYPSSQSALNKIRYCEDLYAREGLPTFFRLTSLADCAGLDQSLADRGYEFDGATHVLHRPLQTGALAPDPGFALASLDSFLSTYADLTGLHRHVEGGGMDPHTIGKLHASVLRAIRGETVFGVLAGRGQPVACGMAVVEGELAGLFDIVTGPECRRRGYGRLLVQSLLAHAAAMGARHAYLQVLVDNAPALALYDGLGFNTLYEYWYRVSKRE